MLQSYHPSGRHDASMNVKIDEYKRPYNGWANRETWNVALWLNNDRWLYELTKSYVENQSKRNKEISYADFLKFTHFGRHMTGDHVSFSDRALNYDELTEMLQEFLK